MADQQLIVQIQADISQMRRQMQTLGSTTAGAASRGTAGFALLNGTLKASVGAMLAIGGAIGSVVTAAGFLVKKGIDYNANMESSTLAWKTLLGSQSKAEEQMNKIQQYAKNTQFDTDGVDKMAKYFHNAGYEGQKLFDQVGKIADVSGAFNITADNAKELARQMSQVDQAGVAYTEDLNILQDQGVPIFKAIAAELHTNVAAVRQMASQGKISADIYNKAFDSVAKPLKGMADAQSKTFNGMKSTLSDDINIMAGELSKPIFDHMKAGMANTIKQVENFNAAFKKGGIGAALKAFLPSNVVDSIMKGVKTIQKGIKSFQDAIKGDKATKDFQKDFKGVGDVVSKVMNVITKLIPPAVKIFTTNFKIIWGIAEPIFKALWDIIKYTVNQIQKIFQNDKTMKAWAKGFNDTMDTINKVLPYILNIVTSIINEIKDVVKLGIDFIVNTVIIVMDIFAGNWGDIWKRLEDMASAVWTTIKSTFKNFMDMFGSDAYNGAMKVYNNVVAWIKNLPSQIGIYISNMVSTFGQKISSMASSASAWAKQTYDNLVAWISGLPAKISSYASSIATKFGEGISSMASSAYAWGKSAVISLANGITDFIKNVSSASSKLYNIVWDEIGHLWDNAYKWGTNMLDGFIQGIKDMYGKGKKAISGFFSAIGGHIIFNSPSKEGIGRYIDVYGANMIQGFIDGMLTKKGDMVKATADILGASGINKAEGNLSLGLDTQSVDYALNQAKSSLNMAVQNEQNKQMAVELTLKGGMEKFADEVEARVVTKLSNMIGGRL